MVPEISTTWEPPSTIYKSPNLDALAYKSPPGLVANIINNRGLVAALSDLITSEKMVVADIVEKEPDLLPYIVDGIVLLAVANAVACIVIKKKTLHK